MIVQQVTVHLPPAALDDLSQLVADPLGRHAQEGVPTGSPRSGRRWTGSGWICPYAGKGPAPLSLSWSRAHGASEGSTGT